MTPTNWPEVLVTTSADVLTVHAIYEPPHDFHEMHHHTEDGKHYCPTGFAMCSGWHDGVLTDCDAVREFDGDCRLWDAYVTDDFDMTADEFQAAIARATPVRIVTSRREYLIRRRLNYWESLIRFWLCWWQR